jgi:hypothetical protein
MDDKLNKSVLKLNKSTSTSLPYYKLYEKNLFSKKVKMISKNISLKDIKQISEKNKEYKNLYENNITNSSNSSISVKKIKSLYFNVEQNLNPKFINNKNKTNMINSNRGFQSVKTTQIRNIIVPKSLNKIFISQKSDENRIVDINEEFIKKIKEEIESVESGRNASVSVSKRKTDISFKKKKNENLKKICEISPFIYTKIIKSKEKLPILFKKFKDSFENNLMNNSKKKKSINLKSLILYHSSTVRKSFREFKVKNYSFKQSLQLKDIPLDSIYYKNIKNKNKSLNISNDFSINIKNNSLLNYKGVYL